MGTDFLGGIFPGRDENIAKLEREKILELLADVARRQAKLLIAMEQIVDLLMAEQVKKAQGKG